MSTRRTPTVTSRFGSGRREGHDASAFYERFVGPEISAEDQIREATGVDVVHCGDARTMRDVADDSIALVVTSPPYFAGKAYEEDLSADGVPSTYFEYLQLLRDVFSECKRVLEPGGRIAVNVANLGRRPYRSLSGDVTRILEDLGLLMRGEVIWCKGRAAGGSCAWGSFQRPANPVLRDVTERVVIAAKGRFDRALTARQRSDRDLPCTATISKEEFMEATTDLWEIAPESATRVGHPAPFPVELPLRLINLYTYAGDVVLDPFMGSGSTAVAAVRSSRRFVGYDTDEAYVAIANERIEQERGALADPVDHERIAVLVESSPGEVDRIVDGDREPDAAPDGPGDPGPVVRGAVRSGLAVKEVAELLLEECGFSDITRFHRLRGLGVTVDLAAEDSMGQRWLFEVSGSFSSGATGLRRADALWRAIGRASVIHEGLGGDPLAARLVLLSTGLPTRGTEGARALSAVLGAGRPVFDVIDLLSLADHRRLCSLAAGMALTS